MLNLTKKLSEKFPKLRFGYNQTETEISVSNDTFYKNVRRVVNPDMPLQERANIYVEMIKELRASDK